MTSLIENFKLDSIKQLSVLLNNTENWNAENENGALTAKHLLKEIFRLVHTVKGSAAAYGLLKIHNFAHKFEDFLEYLCRETDAFDKHHQNVISQCLISLISAFQSLPSEEDLDEKLLENLVKTNSAKFSDYNILKSFIPEESRNLLTENEARRINALAKRGERLVLVEKGFPAGSFAQEFYAVNEKVRRFAEIVMTFPAQSKDAKNKDIILLMILAISEKTAENSEEILKNDFDRVVFDTKPRHILVNTEIVNDISVSSKDVVNFCSQNAQFLAEEMKKDIRFAFSADDFLMSAFKVRKIETILLHLLRNAADHAIESEAERIAAGKKARGEISVKIATDEQHICLEVTDDGRGIDWSKIESAAREQKFLTYEEKVSDEKIRQMIFVSGFSTSKEKTSISGRGIGLDIVKNEVENLQGKIEVSSKLKQGTTFSIRFKN